MSHNARKLASRQRNRRRGMHFCQTSSRTAPRVIGPQQPATVKRPTS